MAKKKIFLKKGVALSIYETTHLITVYLSNYHKETSLFHFRVPKATIYTSIEMNLLKYASFALYVT